jgi:glutathione synthetase
MSSTYSTEKPPLSQPQIHSLIENIKDYQLTHGSLLKNVHTREESAVLARGIPVSLFPIQFPKAAFNRAIRLQTLFNELYVRIASSDDFLSKILAPLIRDDAFTRCLWDIYSAAKEEGIVQEVSLGVFRSDYMIEVSHDDDGPWQLKQVEFNTCTVAGGVHANLVADMHRFLHKTGAYGEFFGEALEEMRDVPVNGTIEGLVGGLTSAHHIYGEQMDNCDRRTGILFIVQHNNYNICDERPLEYGLWNQFPPIPVYRLHFRDILDHVSLGPSRELLFSSPSCPFSPLEISVVYLRAGYEPDEYDDRGRAARLLLEKSRTIKCPSLLSHLTTFKKVQQELAMPGVLEKFLPPEQCADLRATFAPIYPMDQSELGVHARDLAVNPKTSVDYILKPSLEGGGNNIYGSDISYFLETIPEDQWSRFILMKTIKSPTRDGVLMSFDGVYDGPTISELGVFGVCLWRQKAENDSVEILKNRDVGWSFKTKPEEMEEMSVVKGYGFFSSPSLVKEA